MIVIVQFSLEKMKQMCYSSGVLKVSVGQGSQHLTGRIYVNTTETTQTQCYPYWQLNETGWVEEHLLGLGFQSPPLQAGSLGGGNQPDVFSVCCLSTREEAAVFPV